MLSAEKRKLVEKHLGLARATAAKVHRTMGGSVELDDLVAQALEGLSEAACRYDPRAATPFGLFAQYRIRGAIFDWLRSMGYLERRRGRAPDAASCRPSVPGAAGAAMVPPRRRITYLAASEDEDRDAAQAVLSPDPLADVVLAAKHTRLFLAGALHRLPARERKFLVKHYFEDKTMTEAGAELGLSRYQSCRLHARAMARLRASLAAEGFQRAADV